MKLVGIGGIVVTALLVIGLAAQTMAAPSPSELLARNLEADQPLQSFTATAPTIEKPDWYNKRTVYYSVKSNGVIKGNFSEFSTLAGETLNDNRGWSQLGVRFKQVESGGSFTLILSQASLVPNYSPTGCSAEWSCNVGNNVIINDDRWMGATSSWNAAGGNLRDYRHMVVNHETGHWLGHDHQFCSGAGNKAPVMQQQSMGLQGCSFNPWPLPSELWSTRI